jgi:hypothetical protein
MLVCPRSLCRAFARAHHSEAWYAGAPKLLNFPLHELAQDLGERHVSPSRLAFEQRKIVAIGSKGGAPYGHASDFGIRCRRP